MRFLAILKKGASLIMLAAVTAWLAGCGEMSSTPKTNPAGKSSGSGANDQSQSGTTTGKGREVPEAAPADKEADEDMPAEDKASDDKADSE